MRHNAYGGQGSGGHGHGGPTWGGAIPQGLGLPLMQVGNPYPGAIPMPMAMPMGMPMPVAMPMGMAGPMVMFGPGGATLPGLMMPPGGASTCASYGMQGLQAYHQGGDRGAALQQQQQQQRQPQAAWRRPAASAPQPQPAAPRPNEQAVQGGRPYYDPRDMLSGPRSPAPAPAPPPGSYVSSGGRNMLPAEARHEYRPPQQQHRQQPEPPPGYRPGVEPSGQGYDYRHDSYDQQRHDPYADQHSGGAAYQRNGTDMPGRMAQAGYAQPQDAYGNSVDGAAGGHSRQRDTPHDGDGARYRPAARRGDEQTLHGTLRQAMLPPAAGPPLPSYALAAPAPVHAAGSLELERLVHGALTRNILQLVQELQPSQAEQQRKEALVMAVRDAAAIAFPRSSIQVMPFGSFANGLGSRSSDIDLVIVGLAAPDPSLGFYSKSERGQVARLLDQLKGPLRRQMDLANLLIIRSARVPIAKLTTRDHISIDISIANDAGARAAQFISQQVKLHHPLRPLVLTLKALLKAEGLNEVSSGGLSSYGLTYMVLAHLLEEGRQGVRVDTQDLGALLHGFLRRYSQFDMATSAVATSHGGVVPKWQLQGGSHKDHVDRIVVIDPLTGRNCTDGAFRSGEVLALFRAAVKHLAAASRCWHEQHAHERDPDILGPLLRPGGARGVTAAADAPVGQQQQPPLQQQQPYGGPARGRDGGGYGGGYGGAYDAPAQGGLGKRQRA